MKQKPILLIICLAVIAFSLAAVAVAVKVRKNRERQASTAAIQDNISNAASSLPPAAVRPTLAGSPPKDQDPYAPPPVYDEPLHNVAEHVLDANTPPEIGARTRELAQNGTAVSLPIKFENMKRCMIGDYDIISREISQDRTAKLLLSVEPLLVSELSAPPVVQQAALSDLRDGQSRLFLLAPSTRPVLMGLYICKDSNNEGRCGGKQVVDVAQPSTGKPADKIYFFAPFVLEQNKFTAFQSRMQDSGYEQMSAYLAERLGATAEARAGTAKVKNILTTVRPATVRTPGSSIVVDLPVLSRALCGSIKLPQGLKELEERTADQKPQ